MSIKQTLFLALLAVFVPVAHADQGSFTNSGGSASFGSGPSISSTVASPAGTLTLTCPVTTATQCAGGSFSYASNDGTTVISAVFTSGHYVESCSGGGRGGHVSCAWSFTGFFSGTLAVNGNPQAINGTTSQYYSASGTSGSGNTAYNSAYTPFYYSDSEQILRSDDINGTNQIAYGSGGSGVGNFYGAYGIALDSAGRIYVADTYNCRVVRIDDMNGTNWTEYDSAGGCGSGPGQFYEPTGIAVDSLGRIYVMDPYNQQFIRMDDITGANWTVFNSIGPGTGQIYTFNNVTVDSANRIYIADNGNNRVVRMDDMAGTNFTSFTQSQPVGPYIYSLSGPVAVAVDSAGRIYVAENNGPTPTVIRVDDMTGANWSSITVGGNGINSIAVDSTGIVYAGGGGVYLVDNQAGVLSYGGTIAPVGPYYVFGITAVPLPSPRPSAVSFTPPALTFTQNIGTSSTQPITITNFGGSPLDFTPFVAAGGFTESDNCAGTVVAGTSCTANVTFAPTVPGPYAGTLTVNDDSFNLGPVQTLALTGTGTAPAASVTPASLSFQSQVIGSTSNARTITLTSTGTGPLTVTTVIATAPFNQTGTCIGTIAPGSTCTISVTFSPTAIGAASGSVTITDNAGTQTVALTGNGSAPVSLSSSSLNFGSMAVGATSAARAVTLNNRQSVPLNFSSISASGPFLVATNTCGTSIAANSSCSVGIEFSPTALGAATGTLTFGDDALLSPQTVSLSGTGSAPVTLSSSNLSFNNTVVGSTSKASTVTLTNNQNVALNFGGISASAGFAISSNTCGTSIAAAAKCTVGVTFSPTAIGPASGTLVFTDDAANTPQTVTLTGTGSAPVSLSTTSLSLGTVTVGRTSSSKSVSLTNNQSVALSFSSIATTAGFAISSNSCGSSIAAGARCSVSITFTPTATGAVTGALTFTDSAPGSPQTVTLTGTGH